GETVDHRAQARELAPALRAGRDMRLGRGNLALRHGVQSIGAGEIGVLAMVQARAGTHRVTAPPPQRAVSIPLLRQRRAFGLVREAKAGRAAESHDGRCEERAARRSNLPPASPLCLREIAAAAFGRLTMTV